MSRLPGHSRLATQAAAAAAAATASHSHAAGGSLPSSLSSLSGPPEDLSPYRLGREIGRGGFGTVFESLNTLTGESVAIKRLPLAKIQPDELDGVLDELRLLQRLHHENITQYKGMIRTAQYLYIVLELVENGSLAAAIKRFGVFTEQLSALYISQVLRGLAYLHSQGVVHRDIKGGNILVTKEGVIKLADFGVALQGDTGGGGPGGGAPGAKAPAPAVTSVAGSPYWMGPEVIEMAGVSTACDIWSLGSTIVELLSGHPPYWELPPLSAMFHIVQDAEVPLPEGLSPACRDFLSECFRKEPSFRKTAAELAAHPWVVNNVAAIGREKDKRAAAIVRETSELMMPTPARPPQPVAKPGGGVGGGASGGSSGSVPKRPAGEPLGPGTLGAPQAQASVGGEEEPRGRGPLPTHAPRTQSSGRPGGAASPPGPSAPTQAEHMGPRTTREFEALQEATINATVRISGAAADRLRRHPGQSGGGETAASAVASDIALEDWDAGLENANAPGEASRSGGTGGAATPAPLGLSFSPAPVGAAERARGHLVTAAWGGPPTGGPTPAKPAVVRAGQAGVGAPAAPSSLARLADNEEEDEIGAVGRPGLRDARAPALALKGGGVAAPVAMATARPPALSGGAGAAPPSSAALGRPAAVFGPLSRFVETDEEEDVDGVRLPAAGALHSGRAAPGSARQAAAVEGTPRGGPAGREAAPPTPPTRAAASQGAPSSPTTASPSPPSAAPLPGAPVGEADFLHAVGGLSLADLRGRLQRHGSPAQQQHAAAETLSGGAPAPRDASRLMLGASPTGIDRLGTLLAARAASEEPPPAGAAPAAGPGADPFAALDAEEDFFLHSDPRAEALKAAQHELLLLAERLTPETAAFEPEVVPHTCRCMIAMFRATPALRSYFVKAHGVLHLLDMLTACKADTRAVAWVLRVVNELCSSGGSDASGPHGEAAPAVAAAAEDTARLLESLAIVGMLPAVMQFAAPEYPSPVRVQAAVFVEKLLRGGTAALQLLLVACGGVAVVVSLLSPSLPPAFAKDPDLLLRQRGGEWAGEGGGASPPANGKEDSVGSSSSGRYLSGQYYNSRDYSLQSQQGGLLLRGASFRNTPDLSAPQLLPDGDDNTGQWDDFLMGVMPSHAPGGARHRSSGAAQRAPSQHHSQHQHPDSQGGVETQGSDGAVASRGVETQGSDGAVALRGSSTGASAAKAGATPQTVSVASAASAPPSPHPAAAATGTVVPAAVSSTVAQNAARPPLTPTRAALAAAKGATVGTASATPAAEGDGSASPSRPAAPGGQGDCVTSPGPPAQLRPQLEERFVLQEARLLAIAASGIQAVFQLQSATLSLTPNEFRRLFVRAGLIPPLARALRATFLYVCAQLTSSLAAARSSTAAGASTMSLGRASPRPEDSGSASGSSSAQMLCVSRGDTAASHAQLQLQAGAVSVSPFVGFSFASEAAASRASPPSAPVTAHEERSYSGATHPGEHRAPGSALASGKSQQQQQPLLPGRSSPPQPPPTPSAAGAPPPGARGFSGEASGGASGAPALVPRVVSRFASPQSGGVPASDDSDSEDDASPSGSPASGDSAEDSGGDTAGPAPASHSGAGERGLPHRRSRSSKTWGSGPAQPRASALPFPAPPGPAAGAHSGSFSREKAGATAPLTGASGSGLPTSQDRLDAPPLHFSPCVAASVANLTLLSDVLVTCAQGDALVKVALSTQAVVSTLLRMLRPAPYALLAQPAYVELLLRVLKALKFISMEPVALDVLDGAGAIEALVPVLARCSSGGGGAAAQASGDGSGAPAVPGSSIRSTSAASMQQHSQQSAPSYSTAAQSNKEMQNYVLHTLFNLCRVNKSRQEKAALAGIIQPLMEVVAASPVLKPLALPLLCDLAHAGPRCRALLWDHRGVEFYCGCLLEPYWGLHACNSLAAWASSDSRVQTVLAQPGAMASLSEMFATSSVYIDAVLPPLVLMVERCPQLAAALAEFAPFTGELVRRLWRPGTKPILFKHLLSLLRAIFNAAKDRPRLVRDWGLVELLKDVSQRCGDKVVLLTMTDVLLRDFDATTRRGTAAATAASLPPVVPATTLRAPVAGASPAPRAGSSLLASPAPRPGASTPAVAPKG